MDCFCSSVDLPDILNTQTKITPLVAFNPVPADAFVLFEIDASDR